MKAEISFHGYIKLNQNIKHTIFLYLHNNIFNLRVATD